MLASVVLTGLDENIAQLPKTEINKQSYPRI